MNQALHPEQVGSPSTSHAYPAPTRRRSRYRFALIGSTAVLILWTVLVRWHLADEREQSAWAEMQFGSWPTVLTSVDGGSHDVLSINLTYAAHGTPQLGNTSVGAASDSGDTGNINGSRFITGNEAGEAATISAYVAHPVDSSPHDRFQFAIYSDMHDTPYRLVARSTTGTLLPDSWNTVPISATLLPRTAYWLMYSTNSTSDRSNNLRFTYGNVSAIDRVFQSPSTVWFHPVALILGAIASPLASSLVAIAMALWLARRSIRAAVTLLAVFCLGLALEFVLKRWLFYPVSGTYPSGHTLRITLLAAILLTTIPDRRFKLLIVTVAVMVAVSRVSEGAHYWYEVIGGAGCGAVLYLLFRPYQPPASPAHSPGPSPFQVLKGEPL